jgi:DNA-binding CsgD family transcriptional regulator
MDYDERTENLIHQLRVEHQDYEVDVLGGSFLILRVNELAAALLNSSPRALRFMDYRMAIRMRFSGQYVSPCERINSGVRSIREVRMFPGTWIWLDVIYRGIFDERGDVLMIRMVGRDVTELIEAQHQVIMLISAILSDREREVMALLFARKTRKEIAASMGITVNTVDSYRARIMGKLGLKTVDEAVSAMSTIRDAWERFSRR